MKSTGEVMGTAPTFGKAYDKAQDAVGKSIPESGTAVVDLSADEFPDPESEAGQTLREGFAEHYDLVDFEDETEFSGAIRDGEIDFIVSRARDPLEVAVEENVTYFSTAASARAALNALATKEEPLVVEAVEDHPRRDERWGA
jgi:carbamoyl-phosphate synthase large subunit